MTVKFIGVIDRVIRFKLKVQIYAPDHGAGVAVGRGHSVQVLGCGRSYRTHI